MTSQQARLISDDYCDIERTRMDWTDGTRRRVYLLRADIELPLSADPRVTARVDGTSGVRLVVRAYEDDQANGVRVVVAAHRAAMNTWGPKLSEHHLLRELADARDFQQASDARVLEHAPFFVLRVYASAVPTS